MVWGLKAAPVSMHEYSVWFTGSGCHPAFLAGNVVALQYP